MFAPTDVHRDKKYYARLGSKLASLSHRSVLDIIGRQKSPTIDVSLTVTRNTGGRFYLTATVRNTSRIMAKFVLVVIDMPPLLMRRLIKEKSGTLIEDTNLLFFRIRFRNHGGEVLFPDEPLEWTQHLELAATEGLPNECRHIPRLDRVKLRAFADEMRVVQKEFTFEEIYRAQ
jgi:hypothetical protein